MIKYNSFEYLHYNSLNNQEKEKYYKRCYKFIQKLNTEYPYFDNWYRELFAGSVSLKSEREIIICRSGEEITGIAILKKTPEEQKICTLRVEQKYQKMSVGRHLMERSFEWLENDKPVITVHKSKNRQFEKLFRYYDFKLEDKKWNYYRLFSTELSYNGELPSKPIEMENIEIAYMQDIIYHLLKDKSLKAESITQKCIEDWKRKNRGIFFNEQLQKGYY